MATWETQARVARVLPGRLEEAAAVAHPGNATKAKNVEATKGIREERSDEQEIDQTCLGQVVTSFPD
jgi:hypothetical protein